MKKLGDPFIALVVVACSIVLFLALAFALEGNPFDRPSRTLRAEFSDVTGIQPSSLVKYAGAIAGNVHSIRMLTPQERTSSGHPENAVEIVLAINNNVPALNEGLVASVSSDTLLSDKFVLIAGGDPKAPALANNAVIASIAPVTFDATLRDLAEALASMHKIFGSLENVKGDALQGLLPLAYKTLNELNDIVGSVKTLLNSGNTLLGSVDSMVKTSDGLIADGRSLIDKNSPAITKLLTQLSQTVDTLDALAKRADQLVKTAGPNIDASSREARNLLSELKKTATSAHALIDQLRARPQSLIFGAGRPSKPPSN